MSSGLSLVHLFTTHLLLSQELRQFQSFHRSSLRVYFLLPAIHRSRIMVHFNTLFISSIALGSYVTAGPILQKRIAQTISASTADWVKACQAAGGAQQCGTVSQNAFMTLLAAGKNCDQQNAADQMIDLAKTLNNNAEMIRLTQLFVQQPRNAPDSLQVPYCQTAPKNAELNGLFHCQFQGTVKNGFSGDQTGNTPLGGVAVNPIGSCPAKQDGPVPDGVQLNTLVQNPGVGSSSGTSSGASSNNSSSTSTAATAAATSASSSASTGSSSSGSAGSSSTGSSSTNASTTSSFQKQNGLDAIALNQQFASLTPSSPCTAGSNACVNGGFAQCVNNKFAITQCSGGTQCFALPLVNKPGTSIACTTKADFDARIQASGA